VTEAELRFVAATPVWWQTRAQVAFCLELGEEAEPAVGALAEVAALDGPLPEVLMLVPSAGSPSAGAVQDWLLDHLWLPALLLEGPGGLEALSSRARAPEVRAIPALPAR